MTVKRTEKEPFEWDTEIYMGSLATAEKQRITVNLCKKDDKSYINIVKLIKVKENFKPVRGIAISYHAAQQVAAMLNRAFNEGKLLGFDKLK